ncbi:hypothetical protein FNV43_RR18678 [Rhamnella rubrinervis]|uniref:DUF6821 domain-containing protein n=1 Tax=Rhamnella rubrinervis TaxID=2594499 RepID=A0A8K0GVW0_9ROSA|nr:hypothetical protein FNV43_RR18678 [Rhamnella rubrinervis]
MEGQAGELQDWEVLNSSETGLVNSSNSAENPRKLEGVEDDTEGMIRDDYFSLDNQGRYAKEGDLSEEGSIESDNPSWIDPGSETRYPRKNSGEFWSDSGSDRSDDRKISDFAAKTELDFADNVKSQVGFDGIGEIHTTDKDSSNFWSDSGGDGLVSKEIEGVGKGDGMDFTELDSVNNSIMELEGDGNSAESERVATEEVKSNEKSDGVGEKRMVVWWKVPFELLKYCVFRVSPVWTFSVAAAVMGFVILGRRLYKMKRKSQSLQLKVTMDDKKVSQFMSRAARLNEAFSVVRRVPIVRPALPAAGLTPWPVMSLR